MAEASFGSTSPVGSLSSEDHDFDPTAEMLVHDYDDERTMEEEEETQEGGASVGAEIADLEKEGNMPLEELLAMYRYEASLSTAGGSMYRYEASLSTAGGSMYRYEASLSTAGGSMYRYEASLSTAGGSSTDSSSVELTDELPDMTLDKEEIAKDLLSGDEETQSSADDLTPSVTSHEASDFFPRTLRSNAIYDGDKESEGEEDGVCPDDSRKEIMVGFQYQAEIPALCCKYDEEEKVYENEDQLLWQPDILQEQRVKDYLRDTAALVVSGKVVPEGGLVQDNEQALYELVKCNYNVRDALDCYRRSDTASKGEMSPWSEEECRNFEHALLLYEKNFHLVQKHKVKTRTVAECVSFYYMWKKSERFDFFVQQNRFGKKKYSSYPGVTDLMDRLVDEAEGLVDVCSGGGGRMEPSAEQQLNLLNSITASDLSALSSSVVSVCNPGDVSCLDYGFPSLDSLHHRASLSSHDPDVLGFPPSREPDCLLDAGFYHSEPRGTEACDHPPPKRLKMNLAEPFNEPAVGSHHLDYQAARPHRITSAKMAVSVTDLGEPPSYLGAHAHSHTHTLHPQHTALQSE